MKKATLIFFIVASLGLCACVQNESDKAKEHQKELLHDSGNIGKKTTPAPF